METATAQQGPRLAVDSDRPGAGVGAVLRGARLACDEDLREVAAALRIRLPYLEALEDGRIGDLPGIPYAIGFVRAYSDYLGLDTADIVGQFKDEARGVATHTQLQFPEPLPGNRVPGAALLLIVLLLAGVVYGGWLYAGSENRTLVEIVEDVPDRLAGLIGGAEEPGEAAGVAAAPPPGSVGFITQETESETPSRTAVLSEAQPSEEAPPEPMPSDAASATSSASSVGTGEPGVEEIAETADAPADAAPVPPETEQVRSEGAGSERAGSEEMGSGDDASGMAEPEPSTDPAGREAASLADATPPDDASEPSPEAPAAEPYITVTETAAATQGNVPAEVEADTTENADPENLGPENVGPENVGTENVGTDQTGVAGTDAAEPAVAEPPQPEPPQPEQTAAVPDAVAGSAPPASAIETEDLPAPSEPEVGQGEDADTTSAAPPAAAGSQPETSAAEEEVAATPDRIIIQATTESFIQIVAEDGTIVTEKLMLMGEIYRVPARTGLVLNTGNAGALKLLVNGTLVPPLGAPDEIIRGIPLNSAALLPG